MAHPDLDELLDVALDCAKQLLAKQGAFLPFAVAMGEDGKAQMYGGYNGQERPDAREILELLVGSFRARAAEGTLRAVAVCVDVRTVPPGAVEKTDAIGVWLEHVGGEAVDVGLPYRKGGGGWEYGELFAVRGGHGIFGGATGG